MDTVYKPFKFFVDGNEYVFGLKWIDRSRPGAPPPYPIVTEGGALALPSARGKMHESLWSGSEQIFHPCLALTKT